MEKKYRLLKDLLGIEAGTVFTEVARADKPGHGEGCVTYSPEGVWLPSFVASEMNPPWFEEITVRAAPAVKPETYTREQLHDFADFYYLSCMQALSQPARKLPNIRESWEEWYELAKPHHKNK